MWFLAPFVQLHSYWPLRIHQGTVLGHHHCTPHQDCHGVVWVRFDEIAFTWYSVQGTHSDVCYACTLPVVPTGSTAKDY